MNESEHLLLNHFGQDKDKTGHEYIYLCAMFYDILKNLNAIELTL